MRPRGAGRWVVGTQAGGKMAVTVRLGSAGAGFLQKGWDRGRQGGEAAIHEIQDHPVHSSAPSPATCGAWASTLTWLPLPSSTLKCTQVKTPLP